MQLKEQAQAEQEERKIFRRVFDTEDGKQVLTYILNECRYFAVEPNDMDPLLHAFCNRLLNKIGIIHSHNLFEDTAARVDNANDRDLLYILNQKEE